ncbi:MarR family transcriptional regulator [Streptomyces sp. NPDC090022]|uniref:MarR family transcriptional regulator n=1 Tax=Streptomyces sp. NPDC090022 TaxID=3365920 RepID=UPI0037FD426C
MTISDLTDQQLAAQPAAYWTGMAYEALIAFTRARQAEHGYTQPQFWLLRNLSDKDLSPDGQGRTVAALREAMRSYLRPEDDLESESKVLLERGWLARDDEGRLWITEAGETARVDLGKHTPAIRDAIHDGIDDADYVTTLKVLGQMMQNVQGHLPR